MPRTLFEGTDRCMLHSTGTSLSQHRKESHRTT
jgi:hypothetical protein